MHPSPDTKPGSFRNSNHRPSDASAYAEEVAENDILFRKTLQREQRAEWTSLSSVNLMARTDANLPLFNLPRLVPSLFVDTEDLSSTDDIGNDLPGSFHGGVPENSSPTREGSRVVSWPVKNPTQSEKLDILFDLVARLQAENKELRKRNAIQSAYPHLYWHSREFSDDEIREVPPHVQLQNQILEGHMNWTHVGLLRGDDAAGFVDILHQIVDSERRENSLVTTCRRWILRLQRRVEKLPESLSIADVTKISEHPVAGGHFGDIYIGTWSDKMVALKVSKFFTTDENAERTRKLFNKEAASWQQLNHSSILPFYGVSEKIFPGRWCMICPWLDNGNILDYLEGNPICDRLKLLAQAASGVHFLHSLDTSLIHGDLKGANILIDNSERACLCDFGLITFADSQFTTSTQNDGMPGSVRWMAPEILHADEPASMRKSRQTDIYAFGMTILEVFTLKPPFHEELYNDAQILLAVFYKARRPTRPSSQDAPAYLSDAVWNLVELCWNQDPGKRPAADFVLQTLRGRAGY